MTCLHCGHRWVTPMNMPEFGTCDDCFEDSWWEDIEGALVTDPDGLLEDLETQE
jgi:hypothetical protein